MFKRFRNYIEDRKKGPNVKQEYINANGKLVEKPTVKLVADYDGPDAKSPPKSGKETPAPYKPANAEKKPAKAETGFGDEGDSKLIYNPDLKGGDSKLTALGKELGGDWPKTKTENFIYKTRKMDSRQFANYVLEGHDCNRDNLPKVTALEAGSFHPHPSEAIRYVAALTTKNKKFVENFVHEIRRSGTMPALLKAMLEHTETYATLVKLFEGEEGSKRARAFAKAMNETVGPPLGISDDDDEDAHPSDEEHPDDMGDGETPPEDDEEHPDEEMGDEEPSGDEDDEMPPEDDEEHPDEEMGDEEPSEDGSDEENPLGPPKKKAHDNIMGSMKNFESIRSYMKAYSN